MTFALILAAAVGWSGLEPENQIGGRKLSEGYMQGKVALVCRWESKSEAGRDALVRLQQVWQSYKSKPFVLLGSCIDGGASAKSFVEGKGITFPVYSGAGLSEGAPAFEKKPYFYLVDASGRLFYRGTDERRAEEAVVVALTNYASPPDAAYWKRLIDNEVDVLPGRAYLHMTEFRKRFPAEGAAYDDRYKEFKARSEVVKLAQLEAFSEKAKDFDPHAGKQKLGALLSKISTTMRVYEAFKGHGDPLVVQEAKNCLADLKWAEIALKAHLKAKK